MSEKDDQLWREALEEARAEARELGGEPNGGGRTSGGGKKGMKKKGSKGKKKRRGSSRGPELRTGVVRVLKRL